MARFLLRKLSALWKDRFGGVFVYAAIAAPVVIGAAGLSVDIGMWYANKRLAQSAADSGAIAAALEVLRSDEDTVAITAVAVADAANHGYDASEVAVSFLGNNSVEVIVTRSVPGLLSQVIFTETTNVQARAVARSFVNQSCVWALNETDPDAIEVQGSADVELGCGVVVNSVDDDAMTAGGSSCLTATSLKVAGGATGDCLNPTPQENVPKVDDPLAAMPNPDISAMPCVDTGVKINNGDFSLPAGRHCGDLEFGTNGTIIFEPGLHVIDNGKLDIGSQSTVEGTDVSIFMTNGNHHKDSITINGGATVDLSAPTNGPLPGVLLYFDRNADASINFSHKMNGGATMQLSGIVYMPTQELVFRGGAAVQSSDAIIIADKVSFSGNAYLGGFENSPILGNPLLTQAHLVE